MHLSFIVVGYPLKNKLKREKTALDINRQAEMRRIGREKEG